MDGLNAVWQAVLNRLGVSGTRRSIYLGPFQLLPSSGFIEFRLNLDCDAQAARSYEHSKLYYTANPDEPFSEEKVICFRVAFRKRYERVRLVLPKEARTSGYLRLRLVGLPYSQGRFRVEDVRLIPADRQDAASYQAQLVAQKGWVRRQVVKSEQGLRVELPHYPESLCIELSPRCNLTCTHCSSHGTPELHVAYNHMPELSSALLERLAHEVFPHLTVVNLVGRGEPMLASDALWSRLVALLDRYGVLLSCVTNGCFIRQRIDEKVLSLMDTLTVSIDGLDARTFETNRSGTTLEHVLENVRYFHGLRQRVPLARRPRLAFSWTLKKNNIAQFPAFVRFIDQFEPDRLVARHLLVFHEKGRHQSLLDCPAQANAHLREAYRLLVDYGIKHDCPPLMSEAGTPLPTHPARDTACQARQQESSKQGDAAASSSQTRDDNCLWIHKTGVLLSDGEIPTCGNMYAALAGKLDEGISFWDLWNGEIMRSVRKGFGTPQEWDQCRTCWFREIKWHSQRRARIARQGFSLERGVEFSPDSWDFRGREEP